MVPFDRGRHWTPVKLCPYGEGHARFGRVTIVVTMTRCGHKLSLQRCLVRARKVELLRGTPWPWGQYVVQIKTVLAVRRWRVKKKEKPCFFFLLCFNSCVVSWTYLHSYTKRLQASLVRTACKNNPETERPPEIWIGLFIFPLMHLESYNIYIFWNRI